MNVVEIYTREAVKIFMEITELRKAAETDKTLQESERKIIKTILQLTRTKLAVGICDLTQLSTKHEKICDTQQSSTSRK